MNARSDTPPGLPPVPSHCAEATLSDGGVNGLLPRPVDDSRELLHERTRRIAHPGRLSVDLLRSTTRDGVNKKAGKCKSDSGEGGEGV